MPLLSYQQQRVGGGVTGGRGVRGVLAGAGVLAVATVLPVRGVPHVTGWGEGAMAVTAGTGGTNRDTTGQLPPSRGEPFAAQRLHALAGPPGTAGTGPQPRRATATKPRSE